MSPILCPFCEQPCPADAKFCSACGGALHLVPCARCGAVNDVTAAACYQCNAPIAGRDAGDAGDAGAADAAAPPAPAPKPSSPRRAVAAGTAVVVALVALGYFGYRQDSPVDARQPPPASSAAGAGPAAGTAAGDGAQAASAAAAPPEAPLAERVDPQPEEASRTNAAAGLIARPRAAGAAKAPGQVPPRKEVCTPAVEALGLCTMTPEEQRRAEAVAASKATIPQPQAASARPETASPPEAEPQEAPRAQACTEAVAALGLCKPATTQRGE